VRIAGECKEYMKQYMQCLKERKNDNHECRSQSQQYLQCRMDRLGRIIILKEHNAMYQEFTYITTLVFTIVIEHGIVYTYCRGLMKHEEFRKLGYSDDEVKQQERQ